MAERKSKAEAEKKAVRKERKQEVEEAEGKYEDRIGESRMYDLNVTAEERGYEVPEETLAPENELKDDPAGERLNEPDAEDESEKSDDKDSK